MEQDYTILQLQDLSLGYKSGRKSVCLVDNLSKKISKGRVVGVFGVNGVGKTTLLKSISGIIKPLSGTVKYHTNIDVSRVLSFVSTEKIVSGFIKAYDLVGIGRYPYTGWMGILSENDHKIINDALDQANALHLKDRYLNEISDGERQRVMIARAIAQQTEMIVLDEPNAYLDIPNTTDLMKLIRSLSVELNKTIMFSSHNLDVVLNTADVVWIMHDNRVFEYEVLNIHENKDFLEYLKVIKVALIHSEGYYSVKYML